MSNCTKHKVIIQLQNGCTFASIDAYNINTLAKAVAAELLDAIKMDIGDLTIKYTRNGTELDPNAWKKIL